MTGRKPAPMARTPGTEAAGLFDLQIHNNLVTIDKNRYLSEAGRGNGNTRSHPFPYHCSNGWLKFSFFPRKIATWNGLHLDTCYTTCLSFYFTTEAVSGDGFKSKI